MTPRRPSRRDLLIVISELQGLISQAISAHGNDRDPDGFEKGQRGLAMAFEACVLARSFDSPTDGHTIRHDGLRKRLAAITQRR